MAPVDGHIANDVALYWLKDPSTNRPAANVLFAPPTGGVDAHADVVMTTATDATFASMFGDARTDPHTPDVVVKLAQSTIYSLSAKKRAEHGDTCNTGGS